MAKFKVEIEGYFKGDDWDEVKNNIRNEMRNIIGMQQWDFTSYEEIEQKFNIRAQIRVMATDSEDAETKVTDALGCAYPEIDDYEIEEIEEIDE